MSVSWRITLAIDLIDITVFQKLLCQYVPLKSISWMLLLNCYLFVLHCCKMNKKQKTGSYDRLGDGNDSTDIAMSLPPPWQFKENQSTESLILWLNCSCDATWWFFLQSMILHGSSCSASSLPLETRGPTGVFCPYFLALSSKNQLKTVSSSTDSLWI